MDLSRLPLAGLAPEAAMLLVCGEFLRQVCGQTLAGLVLQCADGSTRRIQIPAWQRAAPPPPRPAGWSVHGAEVRHDGRAVRVTGKPGELLRVLVAAGGEMPVEGLKHCLWDLQINERTVANAVSDLRRELKKALALPDDLNPVEGVQRDGVLVAYRLTPLP